MLDWENQCWTGKTSVQSIKSDYMHMIILTKYEREREREREKEREREREYTTRNQYTKNHLRI